VNIKFTTRGIPELVAKLKQIPYKAQKAASQAAAEYLVGNEEHGLKHYPAYKYVSPFKSYSSDPVKAAKQRGWIFTHLDLIGNDNRTGAVRDAWKFKPTGANAYVITNDNPGVKWTMGTGRTRQNEAVGWRKWQEVIQSNVKGAIRAAQAAVNKILKG
jgi:hypothetical protein